MSKPRKHQKLIEFLVGRAKKPTTEDICRATGLAHHLIHALLEDDAFLDRLVRRAGQRMIEDLPHVLASLGKAAADGGNVPATKLFLDTAQTYLAGQLGSEAQRLPGGDADALLKEARAVGIDTQLLQRLASSATTLHVEDIKNSEVNGCMM